MRIPPAEVIAQWPKPNYINPETRGPESKIIGILLIVLVAAVLAVRLYARKWLTKGFGLDDTLMMIAYAPALAFTIIGLVAEDKFQWNRHIWDVDPKFFTIGLQISLLTVILFDLSTNLIKLSMLAMIFRLAAASNDKRTRIFVLVLSFVIAMNCFIFVIIVIFQCRPVSDYWTLSLEPQNCIDEPAHLAAANIINTITDFVVVLLPIRTIIGLELPAKQRIIVTGLFGVGLFASAAGIARTYFTWILTTSTDRDTTWNAWAVWLASTIELNLGIICASIPGTKPFFASYLPRIVGSTLKSHHSRYISWDKAVGILHSPVHPTPIKYYSPGSDSQLSPTPPLVWLVPVMLSNDSPQPVDMNKPLPPIKTTEPGMSQLPRDPVVPGRGMRTLTPSSGRRHPRSAIF
ncbi:hypothetical protein F5X96DRAFT_466158 [Biscogniauxia mediterranea]|nr:hypothetical protein F5X96DRAFT_466158 [Biscogniauxia mediterranea]